MLILKRTLDGVVWIRTGNGTVIRVMVTEIRKGGGEWGQVKIGVEAGADVSFVRAELLTESELNDYRAALARQIIAVGRHE